MNVAGSSDLNEEDYRSFLPLPGSAGQIQLWQFLLELLDCPDKFKDIIVWEGICLLNLFSIIVHILMFRSPSPG